MYSARSCYIGKYDKKEISRYRYNVYGSDIAYIRDILLQLPKTWKKDDLALQGLQSLKYANTPTDIWKQGKEPDMLYPTNLVKKPLFELHLDKDDKPLFLYSNTELPLTPAFRKTKKSKSLKSLKSLKKKKINKSKSLKKKKSKNLKSLKTNKIKKI